MSFEKIIDEDFVRTQMKELCRGRRGNPYYECELSTADRPASWEQCAQCVGSSFIGLTGKGFYLPGFAGPDPGWCDAETQEVLNTCLCKSLTNIDWLLHLSKKRYRDHASHQLFVGALGWFLLHCLLPSPSPKATDGGDQTLKQWIAKRLELSEEDVEVAWWVSSLLHDHAYPLAHMLQVPPSLVSKSLQSRHRAPFWARFLTRPVITTSCAISPELW
jgi:hypothetical protein